MPKSPTSSDLISPEYLAEQQRLHADPRGYGGRGSKWAEVVSGLIIREKFQSVLDYGCGQGTLMQAVFHETGKDPESQGLPNRWINYDPAVKLFSDQPNGPFDLVVCTDVMEHLEGEKIPAVLNHLRSLTRAALFAVVSTVPTAKTLSDGRQAHITIKPQAWWDGALFRAGFVPWPKMEFENPKPEKQFVSLYTPA